MSQLKTTRNGNVIMGKFQLFIVSAFLLLEIENEINSLVWIFLIKWEGIAALI